MPIKEMKGMGYLYLGKCSSSFQILFDSTSINYSSEPTEISVSGQQSLAVQSETLFYLAVLSLPCGVFLCLCLNNMDSQLLLYFLRCWNIHTKGYFWIIEAPIMLTICVSLFLSNLMIYYKLVYLYKSNCFV